MARPHAKSDFSVPVEGVGVFTFGKRSMKDEIAIQVEFARMIGGVEPTDWLNAVCGWIAALKVLTVTAPDDWDIDDMDPLDKETYAKLSRVYEELTNKERSFRLGRTGDGEAASA